MTGLSRSCEPRPGTGLPESNSQEQQPPGRDIIGGDVAGNADVQCGTSTGQGVTSENERVVRRIFELFNRLDPDPRTRSASRELEELMELLDPKVEFAQSAMVPGADVSRGQDAFAATWGEWLTVWEEHRSQITEIEERGNSLLVLTHNWLRGRDGIELEFDNPAIFTLSRGRVTHMRDFLDEAAARATFEEGDGS